MSDHQRGMEELKAITEELAQMTGRIDHALSYITLPPGEFDLAWNVMHLTEASSKMLFRLIELYGEVEE